MFTYRKNHDSKKVRIALAGGLGNQLFMFVAALLVARLNGCGLQIYSPTHSKGHKIHGSSIEKFNLFPWAELLSGKFHIRFSDKLQVKLLEKVNRNLKLANFLSYYRSDTLGYDNYLQKLSPPVTIEGYFQSHRYYLELLSLEPNFSLKLKNPSKEFHTMQRRLRDIPLTVIHVRLGDYKQHQNTVGILSPKYYENALLSLKIEGTQVVIMSDDIIEARNMLAKLVPQDALWLSKFQVSAEETMALMWLGEQYIIGNSSFAFWGAAMAKNPRNVVAPSKWFKGIEDPSNLVPTEWLRTQSFWL